MATSLLGQAGMDRHEKDVAEIDLLVSELTAKRVARAQPAPAGPAAPPPVRPAGRWTNVQIAMPAQPRSTQPKRFALGSSIPAITLPQLPELPAFTDLSRLIPTPGPVAMVRIWVGLGAVLGALMTFWPYSKTYVGLVLYILSLAVALVAGVWGARLSWDARLGAAHTIAVGTAGWVVALAAFETVTVV